MRVRQVYFHERQSHREQRVPQGNAGMRERAGIEDQEADASRGGTANPVDQLMLGVALEGHELVAGFASHMRCPLFNRLERVRSVDPGLATAEQVQIRAI